MATKYHSLEEHLIRLIESGQETAPDGRFLSERRVAEMFNVSRTTARRSIAELSRQGYLLQIHGKGTYLKKRERSQSLYSVIRCTQHFADMGLHPSITVLRQEVLPASEDVARGLHLPPGDSILLLIKLYKADRTIFNVTVSYLPLLPGLEQMDFSAAPIMEILRTRYGASPKRTENSLEAILPPPDIAEHLRISPNTPIMLFDSVTSGTLDGGYMPLEYFKCYYKTDMLRFHFVQDHDAPD